MPYTYVEDVAVELGRPISSGSPEAQQVESWIARVEARIADRVPDLATKAAEVAYRDRLVGVVVAVVARKANNPEGLRSERIDDYYSDRGSSPAGDLWPTQQEWGELMASASAGAFSVRGSYVPDSVAW